MESLILADLSELLNPSWRFLSTPWASTPWTDWHGFWLTRIFDDRFLIMYFLPLLPVLLLVPPRRLRHAIVITCLVFMAYVFGVLWAGLWLLTCVVFFHLSERLALEFRRKDVLPIGPPLAAWAIFGGWYVLMMVLDDLKLPIELNLWLHEHVPWIFPLGARGGWWEPTLACVDNDVDDGLPGQLFHALLWDVHYVGPAYLAIRMLQYLSEIKRGNLPPEQRSLLRFLAFVCYAPTLIQGPIERFAAFQDALDKCHQRRGWHNVPPALWRIGMGVAKSIIVTLYFHPLFWYTFGLGNNNRLWLHPEQIESFWLLYFSVFLIIFGLYLEFSGYCDIAIGFSRLLGYRLCENFYMPWIATSMRDFWRRWHISLSLLLRDYVYIPLGGNRRHALLNVCITFFLIGIWHELVPQVGIWGILMGLMVGVNQGWVDWMKRIDAQPTGLLPAIRRSWLRLRPLPQICAWLITQHAFVFSLLIFFGGSGAIAVAWELLRRIVG